MPVFTIDTLRTAIGEQAFMSLADRDGDRVLGAEDTDAVQRAIDAGIGDIDSRIKGKFATPIENPSPELREAYLNAICYHMQPRGRPGLEDICERYKLAIQWAKDVKGDEAQLTSEVQPSLRRTPAARQTGTGRKFTTSKLRDVL